MDIGNPCNCGRRDGMWFAGGLLIEEGVEYAGFEQQPKGNEDVPDLG